jgi:hypothetical protein
MHRATNVIKQAIYPICSNLAGTFRLRRRDGDSNFLHVVQDE